MLLLLLRLWFGRSRRRVMRAGIHHDHATTARRQSSSNSGAARRHHVTPRRQATSSRRRMSVRSVTDGTVRTLVSALHTVDAQWIAVHRIVTRRTHITARHGEIAGTAERTSGLVDGVVNAMNTLRSPRAVGKRRRRRTGEITTTGAGSRHRRCRG